MTPRPLPVLLVSAALCGLALTPNASAADCTDDSIRSVTSDGEIIVMLSGAVFEVLPGDTIDSALWLPASDVIICMRSLNVRGKQMKYYEIINLDDKEKVGATRLR